MPFPILLTHHDHPDCEDYGYVVDTGMRCDTCTAAWWRHFTQAEGDEDG